MKPPIATKEDLPAFREWIFFVRAANKGLADWHFCNCGRQRTYERTSDGKEKT
jgi:hypothetical protein